MAGPRIIIGLHYGLSYTAVAYAFTNGEKPLRSNDIRVIRSWPGRDAETVPSILGDCYIYNTSFKQFGYDISPGSTQLVEKKKLLDIEDVSTELRSVQDILHLLELECQNPSRDGIHVYEAEWVVAAFLGDILRSTYDHIRSVARVALERVPLDVVTTTQADWSYQGLNSFHQACVEWRRGRMTPTLYDMILVTEHEAAVINTVESSEIEARENYLEIDEMVIVCDIGAKITKFTTYRVKQIDPSLDLVIFGLPSRLEVGYSLIHNIFQIWLQRQFGDRPVLPSDSSMLVDRFQKHLDSYSGIEADDSQFNIPLPRDFRDGINGEMVEDGVINVSGPDMKSFFDPLVKDIVWGIDMHLTDAGRDNHPMKRLFIFSDQPLCPYTCQTFKDALELRGIELLAIPEFESKFATQTAKGAVLHGATKSTKSVMKALHSHKSYGVLVHEKYSGLRHEDHELRFHPASGEGIAERRLHWLLKRGDLLFQDQPLDAEMRITYIFAESDSRKGKVDILSLRSDSNYDIHDNDWLPSTLEEANEMTLRPDDIYVVQSLEWDLTSFPLTSFEQQAGVGNHQDYFVAELDLLLKITIQRSFGPPHTNTTMEAKVSWQGQLISS